MGTYRLYIDEVGNAGMRVKAPHDENDRFLSLTGVAIRAAYVIETLGPEMYELKRRYFCTDPDVPVILHRSEMLKKKGQFKCLADSEIEADFYRELLALLEAWQYTVICVVIDKQRHKQLYQVWQAHPYHYCLKVLLERYIMFLQGLGMTGDVMAESRQAKDDMRLKGSYSRLYRGGTDRISEADFQCRLSSGELKVKPKSSNIAGLQLADLVACCAQRGILDESGLCSAPRGTYDQDVWRILEEGKFHRTRSGKAAGVGKKLLP